MLAFGVPDPYARVKSFEMTPKVEIQVQNEISISEFLHLVDTLHTLGVDSLKID